MEQENITYEQFYHWLKGFIDISADSFPSQSEWDRIKAKMNRVSHPFVYPINKPIFIEPRNPLEPYGPATCK